MASPAAGEVLPGEGQYSFEALFPLRLSRINGRINSMKKDDLCEALEALRLDTRGCKEVLKKRMKNFYRSKKFALEKIDPSLTKYPYLIVIDYEATCERETSNYPHEIIEFPAILVDVAKEEVVDEFHEYCKPVLNPCLTAFCTELTGIRQEDVDGAGTFPLVLGRFEEWLSSHGLGTTHKFAVVTDGPWDMARFLHSQCCHSRIPYPRWGRKWVNIRKIFYNSYRPGEKRGITSMLTHLGLTFEGRLHCGLDDTRNIGRILLRMLADKVCIKVNEFLRADCRTTEMPGQGEASFSVYVEKPGATASSPDSGPVDGRDGEDAAGGDLDRGESLRFNDFDDEAQPPGSVRRSPGSHNQSASRYENDASTSTPASSSVSWGSREHSNPDQEDDMNDLLQYLAIQKSM